MIRTEDIAQGRVDGHIAYAERPRGGILILPTITGVDGFMRDRATMLAEAGYTSMVWNPYPGEAPPADTQAAYPRAAKLTDAAVEGMSECLTHMIDKLKVPKVATLGYCLGGRYAVLLAAKDPRLAACVAYYPSIRVPNQTNQSLDALALAAGIQCPVHVVHGTADQVFLHDVFLKLRDVLDARKVATFAQVHPDAVHSFMRPELRKVEANDRAARLSWPPVMGFLDICMPQAG